MGYDLYHLHYSGGGGRSIVRVYIETEAGITLDDCAAVSRRLGVFLDAEDLLPGAYTLEVSSPGLDRPLFNEGHYRRFTGRKARVSLRVPIEGRRNLRATIQSCENNVLRMADDNGRETEIPLSQVASGRLEMEIEKR
jgi:ribosome maturation factor RimP